ncbi:MAG: DUF4962 domain-containing protein, partial [Armatimonadota bacterium]
VATALVSVALMAAGGEPIVIGAESVLPVNPRSEWSRYINWRPADGEVVDLNPPRMSWPYNPGFPHDVADALHSFTLQIADNPQFRDPVVDVSCWFNFYNTLPALGPARTWYWRVGYDVGTQAETWSAVRSFTLADDAVVWDRAALADLDLAAMGHPRVLLRPERMDELRALAQTDAGSRAAFERMQRAADAIVAQPWWTDFPHTDRAAQPEREFYRIAEDLATVAFVWKLTGDARYAGVVERAVTWASYPPGGRASPEGLGGDGAEDATQGNEFLALLFDWLYQDMTDAQRQVMIGSLEWRVDHIMNNFSWARGGSRIGSSGALLRLTWRPGDGSAARPTLPPADDWQPFDLEIPVPEGTTGVVVEPFNYYWGGTVSWASLSVRTSPAGPNLLRNSDFSERDGERPASWSANVYGTQSRPVWEPRGGPDGAAAVTVTCDASTDRGSWQQTIDITGAKTLYVSGWYRARPSGELARPPARLNGGMAGMISSHAFEAAMDTAVCGLVLAEHSEIGRQWFELSLNYLIGITCGFGFDEAWNEGAGYGSSKNKWLTNASLYFDTALPDADLGRNPYYPRLGDWLRRIIPVGMNHHAWGNQANASRGNHLATFRKLAYLTGDGRFLYNWLSYGGELANSFRPWIEYVLPAYYHEPEPQPEGDPIAVFPIDGWAMAASGPPSDPRTYAEGTGVILQCRPRGGYSHSFNSDGSVQLHAYGQMLNHGGGTSANGDAYAYHTMSHNVVLIDGLGQAQPSAGMRFPTYGHIAGFARGEDFVYFAADPTLCYPKEPGNFSRWSLPLHEVYTQRALPYLESYVRHVLFVRERYFVIYDDLRCSQPASFTWLWHILPGDPLSFDAERFAIDYTVGDVPVRLQQIYRPAALALDDRQGLEGRANPITGEDYRAQLQGDIIEGHNLWISNREPAAQWGFLAVVYPQPPGGAIPPIEPIDDRTVRVGDDVICFDPTSAAAAEATIVVDPEAFVHRPVP